MPAFHLSIRREDEEGVASSGGLRHLGWLISHSDGWETDQSGPSSGSLVTPGWPEPASVRIEWTPQQILLVPDHAAVATIFYRSDIGRAGTGDGVVASTEFDSLIEGRGVSIRSDVIEECAFLGHALGAGTLVDSVHRVVQGQALRLDADGTMQVVRDSRTCPMSIPPDDFSGSLERSGDLAGTLDQTAIEMTGGLDSRLSLAMLLANGSRPGHAITFGISDSIDVKVARELARSFGIEHHVLRLECHETISLDLAISHVLNSGGLLSFTKYAPLMWELNRAASFRTSQVSGLGGELAINFYQVAGLDSLVRRGRFAEVIRHRVLQVPPALARLGGDGVEKARLRVAGQVAAVLDGYPVKFEDKLRYFYSQERMNNWAFVGLNANRFEYALRLPLLSSKYLGWSNSLSKSKRDDRSGQFELLRSLSDRIPNGDALLSTKVAGARGFRKILSHSKKLLLRAMTGVDPRRDADTVAVLDQVVADERLFRQLRRLEDLEVFGRRFTIDDLRLQAASGDMLAGMFVTAAAVLDRAECGER